MLLIWWTILRLKSVGIYIHSDFMVRPNIKGPNSLIPDNYKTLSLNNIL